MRYNALTKKNLWSAADRDVALAKWKWHEAQLNERRITAPFNGVIEFVRVASVIWLPGTIITTIDDVIKLDFSVPRIYISSLSME